MQQPQKTNTPPNKSHKTFFSTLCKADFIVTINGLTPPQKIVAVVLVFVLINLAFLGPQSLNTYKQGTNFVDFLINEKVPNDFTMEKITTGTNTTKWTINQPEPFIIRVTDEEKSKYLNKSILIPENLIVFDKNSTLGDFENKYRPFVLVNGVNILVLQEPRNSGGSNEKNEDKIAVYPISSFEDGTINKDVLKEFAKIVKIVWAIFEVFRVFISAGFNTLVLVGFYMAGKLAIGWYRSRKI